MLKIVEINYRSKILDLFIDFLKISVSYRPSFEPIDIRPRLVFIAECSKNSKMESFQEKN